MKAKFRRATVVAGIMLSGITMLFPSVALSQSANAGIFIKNQRSNRCIDVAGAPGTGNGASLILFNCESSGFNSGNGTLTDQKWEFINGGFIRNVLSKKCIDVAGAPGIANATSLQLFDCEYSGSNGFNGSPTDQKWEYIGAGFIRNILSNRCIDVAGAPGTANGAPLQLFNCELSGINSSNGTVTDQRWRLIPK